MAPFSLFLACIFLIYWASWALAEPTFTIVSAPPAPEGPAPFSLSFYIINTYPQDVFDLLGAFYEWDWGDGSEKARGTEARHTFLEPGTYQVSWRKKFWFLQLDWGQKEVRALGELARRETEAESQVPRDAGQSSFLSASLEVLPEAASHRIEEPLSFRLEVSNEKRLPLSFFWEFGDGETSEEAEPRHSYARPGEYEVTGAVYVKRIPVIEKKELVRIHS